MQNWVYKTIITTLLGIIGFFLIATFTRLSCIEKELLQVRIDIAQMRIPSQEEIREICKNEILKHEVEKR